MSICRTPVFIPCTILKYSGVQCITCRQAVKWLTATTNHPTYSKQAYTLISFCTTLSVPLSAFELFNFQFFSIRKFWMPQRSTVSNTGLNRHRHTAIFILSLPYRLNSCGQKHWLLWTSPQRGTQCILFKILYIDIILAQANKNMQARLKHTLQGFNLPQPPWKWCSNITLDLYCFR